MVEQWAWHRVIKAATGVEPSTCPWRALYDPLVIEVIQAYRWFESGQLALFIGEDPPAVLVEAIGIYHSAVRAVVSHDRQL